MQIEGPTFLINAGWNFFLKILDTWVKIQGLIQNHCMRTSYARTAPPLSQM